MPRKILIIDDDVKIVEMLKIYLEKEGFEIVTAFDGWQAVEVSREQKPDLAVLDLMLPGLSGWEVCKKIREQSKMPIIMLTARDSETDKLLGLELGADDYVTKPFSLRELVARVKAVLRRTGGELAEANLINTGEIVIDLEQHTVKRGKTYIDITPTEFKIISTMAGYPGKVFTRLQLIDLVQGYSFEGYERTIDTHIKNLRKKVEPDSKNPTYILTVFGVGYKFRGE